ncbi:MAG: N-acetyltransferase [Sphingobacteriaceae bacterium]|nr:MAG: N-acetyltransferase [Sphingobacteriaceae bacterium]
MIRQATPADAPDIAKLIVLAMGPLAAAFINGTNPNDAIPLFEHFAAIPGNQYSYKNTLIYVNEGGVQGMICTYNGANLDVLRQPFLKYISEKYGFSGLPEDETQAGEYYIDCLSVFPAMQGKGIGKQLIAALIEQGRRNNWPAVGLLVNESNPLAQKLYTSLGFEVVGEKKLLGTHNRHMQYKLM